MKRLIKKIKLNLDISIKRREGIIVLVILEDRPPSLLLGVVQKFQEFFKSC